MQAPMSRQVRRVATLAFVAVCVMGFEALEADPPADETLVFAMSVQAPDGQLLASPVVVGTQGRKVEVHLLCQADPTVERMSLVLDPVSGEEGQMLYSYELSMKGRFHSVRGTIDLAPGRERRISVHPNDPRGVTLALYAAPLRHPGVEKYLKDRRVKLARAAS